MLVNIVGFNFVWFGLIYWGNIFIPIALVMLAIHLFCISDVNNELFLIISIMSVGIIVDSLLQFNRIFIFPHSTHIPFWLMTLWACFAATICHSLAFLARFKFLQITAGSIMAPLSYFAGERLNAVVFGYPFISTYILLGLIWTCLFLFFFYLKSILIIEETKYA
ncbi:DUF2878 domain-containing protein [Psychromonas sp. RZ22]|uniref:DUF2878 domain-containing protein n=1 Tax=Psychromonas algarum TaxID=2555643 RepID=UPI0010673907|nr:DUF2878 domain-containing protein [Psychromonas sp. RZ22]TEW55266.1 DUF2878 domain-containing protein [Psychromonas sp. RZ22]